MGKVLPLDVWRSYLTSDHRAGDFPDDAALWVQLLTAAYDLDGFDPSGLFGAFPASARWAPASR